MTSRPVGNCIVYGRDGGAVVQSIESTPAAEVPDPLGARAVPIAEIMQRSLVCARLDLDASSIVRLMIQHHVGCIPVVDEKRRPLGMITKWDIVEHLDAVMQCGRCDSPLAVDIAPRTAEELMMPLALTLDENASVAQAAEMMTCEDTHHVLVVAAGNVLVGVVSSRDIAVWLASVTGPGRERFARGSIPMPFSE